MREHILQLKSLKIINIESDMTFYKGYIRINELDAFINENKLRVTNKDIDVGAFYRDIEHARVFCFPKPNPYNELIVVYVVPYPNPCEDDNERDDRIAIVDHLMEMVKIMNRYYEMMRVH